MNIIYIQTCNYTSWIWQVQRLPGHDIWTFSLWSSLCAPPLEGVFTHTAVASPLPLLSWRAASSVCCTSVYTLFKLCSCFAAVRRRWTRRNRWWTRHECWTTCFSTTTVGCGPGSEVSHVFYIISLRWWSLHLNFGRNLGLPFSHFFCHVSQD